MPAKYSVDARSPRANEKKFKETGDEIEKAEARFLKLGTAIDHLTQEIAKEEAQGDTKNQANLDKYKRELAEAQAAYAALRVQRTSLEEKSREVGQQVAEAAELKEMPIDELRIEYVSAKGVYLDLLKAASKAESSKLATSREEVATLGIRLVGSLIPPYKRPAKERELEKIKQLASTAQIDTTVLEEAVEAFRATSEAYAKLVDNDPGKASAEREVVQTKQFIRTALSRLENAFEQAIEREERAKGESAPALRAKTMRTSLVLMEHILAEKTEDPIEKDAYLASLATPEDLKAMSSCIQEKIGTEDHQQAYVEDMLHSVGLPLSLDELRALYEERKKAVEEEAIAGRPRAKKILYSKEQFSRDLLDQVCYEIDPELVDAAERDRVHKYVETFHRVPRKYSKDLFVFLGLSDGTVFKTGTDHAMRTELKSRIANYLKMERAAGTPPGPLDFAGNVGRDLGPVYAGFKKVCAEKALEPVLYPLITEQAGVGINRKVAEQELSAFVDVVKKADALEREDEKLKADLKEARKFEDENLAEYAALLKGPTRLREAARVAKTKKDAIAIARAKERTALDEPFAESIRKEAQEITKTQRRERTVKEELDNLSKDPTRKKELDAAKEDLKTKRIRQEQTGAILGKLYDPNSDALVIDESFLANHGNAGAWHFLKESGKIFKRVTRYAEIHPTTGAVIKPAEYEFINALEALRLFNTERKLVVFHGTTEAAAFPDELTARGADWIQRNWQNVARKCELIGERQDLVRAAEFILNCGPYPTALAGSEPADPVLINIPKEPQKPTEPKGLMARARDFFGKLDTEENKKKKQDASDKIKAEHAAWEKDYGDDARINADRIKAHKTLRADWEANKSKDEERRKEWEDGIDAVIGRIQPTLALAGVPPIDLRLEGDKLRNEVARACVMGLEPVMFEHYFSGTSWLDNLRSVEAILPEITLPDPSQPDRDKALGKYQALKKKIEVIGPGIREEEELRKQLTDYLRTLDREKSDIDLSVTEAEAKVRGFQEPLEILAQEKKDLEAEHVRHEAEKTRLTEERQTQLAAFDAETTNLLTEADPANDVEAWEAEAYNHKETYKSLRTKVKKNLLGLVEALIEWKKVERRFPEDVNSPSLAYLAARERTLKDVASIERFLQRRGPLMKAALGERLEISRLEALKTRIDTALKSDEDSEKTLREQILASFPPMDQPFEKKAA